MRYFFPPLPSAHNFTEEQSRETNVRREARGKGGGGGGEIEGKKEVKEWPPPHSVYPVVCVVGGPNPTRKEREGNGRRKGGGKSQSGLLGSEKGNVARGGGSERIEASNSVVLRSLRAFPGIAVTGRRGKGREKREWSSVSSLRSPIIGPIRLSVAFGCAPRPSSPAALCSEISGDAPLYWLFRADGPSVPCPFFFAAGAAAQHRGLQRSSSSSSSGFLFSTWLPFAYDRGKGVCSAPPSALRPCTQRDRVAMHYQACPNVPGSEMMSEWKITFFVFYANFGAKLD